jgi:hypothetical protein
LRRLNACYKLFKLTVTLLMSLGMEQLGAQRFVKYWESRREVFGPDKFALHLTLSEALCDDSVALETCVFSLLPRLDASGRQLLFLNCRRHTREGYTTGSMVRVAFYGRSILCSRLFACAFLSRCI